MYIFHRNIYYVSIFFVSLLFIVSQPLTAHQLDIHTFTTKDGISWLFIQELLHKEVRGKIDFYLFPVMNQIAYKES